MRSCLTVRLYNNTLSNAFKSMDNHLCIKVIFLGTFFLCTNTVRLHFCISGEDNQVFHSDMVIGKRVFHLYVTTVNTIIYTSTKRFEARL